MSAFHRPFTTHACWATSNQPPYVFPTSFATSVTSISLSA
jgi:hypothetical protein